MSPSSLLRAALCGSFFLSLASARAQSLPLTPRVLYQIEGEAPGQRFGAGAWPLDDVDGDGFKDLLITDYWWGSLDPPSAQVWVEKARVYSGANGRELFDLAYEYPQVSVLAVLGTNFAQLDDLDSDGIGDFIAGDSNRDLGWATSRDAFATIFSGRTGEIIRTHRSSKAGFGMAMQGLGDLDGDGMSDYSIETSEPATSGTPSSVAIYSGASGRTRATLTGFGTRAVGVKDLNSDDLADFAVVDEANNTVWFLSGALEGTFDIDNVPAAFVLGRYQNEVSNLLANGTRYTVQNVGDLDGDGFDEIVARLDELPARWPDGLLAISSKTARPVWIHRFSERLIVFGWSLEPLVRVSDLSGDGIPEVITSYRVNIVRNDGSQVRWREGVLVLSGADGNELFFLPTEIPRELATLSDLDGDGVEEVAISDRNWNGGTGRVLVYSFGPGAARPLELAVTTDDQGAVIVSWPDLSGEVVLERSENLVTWRPVEGEVTGNRYVVPPGSPPQQFYRLRHTP